MIFHISKHYLFLEFVLNRKQPSLGFFHECIVGIVYTSLG